MLIILGYFAATIIGLSLGMMGAGGSILSVPALLYLFGLPPKEAINLSLLIVALGTLTPLVQNYLQGNVRLRESLLFILVSSGFTAIGAKISLLILPEIQLAIFIFVMLVAAIVMLKNTSVDESFKRPLWLAVLAASFIGTLTGIVGIGGGFMLVPILIRVMNFPFKDAVGTSLAIIFVNALGGFLMNWGHIQVNFGLLFTFSLFTFLGALIGNRLKSILKTQTLKIMFAYTLLSVALVMLIGQVFKFSQH